MNRRIESAGLKIDPELYQFIERECSPRKGIEAQQFWLELAAIVKDLGPENRALLAQRDTLQAAIDAWQFAVLDTELMKTVCAADYLESANSK